MTKIKILCLTLILLLVVECHLRQTQLSSVSPDDGEKDEAYDILNANLDKLIKMMTLSKGNTVNVTSMIVDIVGLAVETGVSLLPNTPPAALNQKLHELDGRIGQLGSEVLKLQFLTKETSVFFKLQEFRWKVKVPLGTLVSRINRYKGGAEGLPALNASCQEYDTDKLFITYIGDLPDLLAWQMKEANYAKNVWDASVKTIEGISKQLAYVFGLCQVVVLGIPDAWLNKTLHDRAFNWGSRIDNIIKHRFEKMKDL
uniref:Uncharacterized protein n=1 Tax=Panagrolaimus davidi TaxID=227884 RepID=A0A914QS40_9BILA